MKGIVIHLHVKSFIILGLMQLFARCEFSAINLLDVLKPTVANWWFPIDIQKLEIQYTASFDLEL